jgi:hypothetical protein
MAPPLLFYVRRAPTSTGPGVAFFSVSDVVPTVGGELMLVAFLRPHLRTFASPIGNRGVTPATYHIAFFKLVDDMVPGIIHTI